MQGGQDGRSLNASLRNQAFAILGISPTEDGRAIRSAFLRLARIYHPDRFVDMPEDVRDEAERRMKDATVAYEVLRSSHVGAVKGKKQEFDEADLRDRARIYRDAIEARKRRDKRDRERWQRWDEVERLARERAEHESEMAAQIAAEADGYDSDDASPEPTEPAPIEPRSYAALKRRLDAARRGETTPLVPRPKRDD